MFGLQGLGPQDQPVQMPQPLRGGGLGLGSVALQLPSVTRTTTIAHFLRPTPKLELLKRQRFTLEGREERIAKSLAALSQPAGIDLTPEQWKHFAEDLDLDDDED